MQALDFSKKADKRVAQWDGFNAPRQMSERTRKRVLLTRLSIVCPRRPNEHVGHYCAFLAKKVEMDPAEVDEWLYGALYRKDW